MARSGRSGEETERARDWRGEIERWSRSGLTQAEYCRRRRLSIRAFHWWRSEWLRGDREEKRKRSRRGSGNDGASGRPAFLAVDVVDSGDGRGGEAKTGSGVSIALGCGQVIWVEAGFDPAVLREVLRVLEGEAC